jgi:benzoyl-CoA reductase/2-hydroxyglutaryl-CoA dehydratase subunit BcrC/BadD/HgdB
MRDGLGFLAEKYQERYAAKPRGFELYVHRMLQGLTKAFDPEAKIVYVSNYSFPAELLWAFDVVNFDYEIACNNLPQAIMGSGSELMIACEEQGFSRDICSFHRMELGFSAQDANPRGDLYICSSYYCHGKAKAHEAAARREGAPHYFFEAPTRRTESARVYVETQLREIAEILERLTGKQLDMGRFKECIRMSNRARANLVEINELMKLKPCPWEAKKAALLALGGAVFWGSPVLVEVTDRLKEEIQERAASGATRPERFRVLWSPWYPVQPTVIPAFMRDNQISMVMAETADIWRPALDENHPFESLAQMVLDNYMLRTTQERAERLTTLAGEYQVDGLVHFGTVACYHENTAFRVIADAMARQGLPVLDLDGDMTDERNYSEQRTTGKLEAFLEIMAANRSE